MRRRSPSRCGNWAKASSVGALTTAAAFVSFVLSDCEAFAQLGALIAIGILIASVLMMTVFYACLSQRRPPEEHDLLFECGQALRGDRFSEIRKPVLVVTTTLPAGALRHRGGAGRPVADGGGPEDARATCDASDALHTIQSAFPAAKEPLLVLVDAKDAETCHTEWAKIQTAMDAGWWPTGRSRAFARRRAFVLSPELARENLKQLAGVDLTAARASYDQALAAEGFNTEDAAFQNVFKLIDALEAARRLWRGRDKLAGHPAASARAGGSCSINSSPATPSIAAAYVTPLEHIRNVGAKRCAARRTDGAGRLDAHHRLDLCAGGPDPWAKHKLTLLSVVMVSFNVVLLAFLYRRVEPLLILMVSLALSIGAMIACLKIFGFALNLFNVLAFPLVLGVGVDYGIYILLAMRQPGDKEYAFATIIKPVILAGLTAVAGFGSLAIAHNPALRGLGAVSAIGIACCLFSTIFFILPAYLFRLKK